jgi:hypothetical protein
MIEAPRLNAGVIVRLVIVFVLVCAGFWFTYSRALNQQIATGDACNEGTSNANREVADAISHQSIAAMQAATDHGVAAITVCVNAPDLSAVRHAHFVRGLAQAKRAAVRWHAYGPNDPWPMHEAWPHY